MLDPMPGPADGTADRDAPAQDSAAMLLRPANILIYLDLSVHPETSCVR